MSKFFAFYFYFASAMDLGIVRKSEKPLFV